MRVHVQWVLTMFPVILARGVGFAETSDRAACNWSVSDSRPAGPKDVGHEDLDPRHAEGTEDGLLLADRLAWHYQKHLENPTTRPFTEALAQAGHTDVTLDVTPLVVSPIQCDSIDKWMRETGLPEPEG